MLGQRAAKIGWRASRCCKELCPQKYCSISRGALLDHPVQGLTIPLLTWEMWKLIMILLLLPTDAPFIAVPLQCQAGHTLPDCSRNSGSDSRPVDHRVLPPAASGSNPVVAPNLTDAPSPYIPPTGCTLTPRGLGLGSNSSSNHPPQHPHTLL